MPTPDDPPAAARSAPSYRHVALCSAVATAAAIVTAAALLIPALLLYRSLADGGADSGQASSRTRSAQGVVTDVQQDALTLRTDGGKELRFSVRERDRDAVDLAHMRVHMGAGSRTRVEYEERGSTRYAVRTEDLPSETGKQAKQQGKQPVEGKPMSAELFARLKQGMSKQEVRRIAGEPPLVSTRETESGEQSECWGWRQVSRKDRIYTACFSGDGTLESTAEAPFSGAS